MRDRRAKLRKLAPSFRHTIAMDAKHIADDDDDDEGPGFGKRPAPWRPALGDPAANAARLETALSRPAISIIVPTVIEARTAKRRASEIRSHVNNSRAVKAEKSAAEREHKRQRNHVAYLRKKRRGYIAPSRSAAKRPGRLTFVQPVD